MGGKPSKTPKEDLKRSKSISSFGRSSQRFLFQKSKARLTQINKKLLKFKKEDDSAGLDEIKKQLEIVEKDLNDVSAAIKEKNKQKYEEILKYFEETRKNVEDKVKLPEENFEIKEEHSTIEEVQETPKPEHVRKHVELRLVKVISTENLVDIELRKPVQDENGEENFPQPRSSTVKFGVQVMPINPRVSQELLKRNTLPVNDAPKAEFMQIRKMSQSEDKHQNKENELYNYHTQTNEEIEPTSVVLNGNTFYNPPLSTRTISAPSSPNYDQKNKPEKPLKELEKRPINENALQKIESIGKDIDKLEDQLKYFHGEKGDEDYLELHELFVRGLIKLDNVEVHGDPVVRQERKISIQRIQELIKILERLVEKPGEEQKQDVVENADDDCVGKRQEEVVNAEGKAVTATAL